MNALHLLLNDVQQLRDAAYPGKGSESSARKAFNNDAGGWKTTLSLTDIRRLHEKDEDEDTSRFSLTQIPDAAMAVVDIRFTDEWNEKTLLKFVKGVAKNCEVEVLESAPVFVAPLSSKYMQEAAAVIAKHVSKPLSTTSATGGGDESASGGSESGGDSKGLFIKRHGSSDARFFVSASAVSGAGRGGQARGDMGVIMFKPRGGKLHSDKEWLDFGSLVTFQQIVAELIGLWA